METITHLRTPSNKQTDVQVYYTEVPLLKRQIWNVESRTLSIEIENDIFESREKNEFNASFRISLTSDFHRKIENSSFIKNISLQRDYNDLNPVFFCQS